MLNFIVALLTAATFAAVGVNAAVAESGPAETLIALTRKMHDSAGELPALDYIDWESAFADLSSTERSNLNIQSARDLQEHYRKAWTDPALLIEPQIEHQLQTMPEESRIILEQEKASIIQSSRDRTAELNARYHRASYQIGAESINGNSATVDLETEVDGIKLKQQIPFVRRSNTWYIAGIFQFLGSKPAGPTNRMGGSITP